VDAFNKLAQLGFHGPLLIEMWNDDAPESEQIYPFCLHPNGAIPHTKQLWQYSIKNESFLTVKTVPGGAVFVLMVISDHNSRYMRIQNRKQVPMRNFLD
jgi:hypothetical protein